MNIQLIVNGPDSKSLHDTVVITPEIARQIVSLAYGATGWLTQPSGDDAAVEALADLIHPLYAPRDNARNQLAEIRANPCLFLPLLLPNMQAMAQNGADEIAALRAARSHSALVRSTSARRAGDYLDMKDRLARAEAALAAVDHARLHALNSENRSLAAQIEALTKDLEAERGHVLLLKDDLEKAEAKTDERWQGTILASIEMAYQALGAPVGEPDDRDPAYIGEAVVQQLNAERRLLAAVREELTAMTVVAQGWRRDTESVERERDKALADLAAARAKCQAELSGPPSSGQRGGGG